MRDYFLDSYIGGRRSCSVASTSLICLDDGLLTCSYEIRVVDDCCDDEFLFVHSCLLLSPPLPFALPPPLYCLKW